MCGQIRTVLLLLVFHDFFHRFENECIFLFDSLLESSVVVDRLLQLVLLGVQFLAQIADAGVQRVRQTTVLLL